MPAKLRGGPDDKTLPEKRILALELLYGSSGQVQFGRAGSEKWE